MTPESLIGYWVAYLPADVVFIIDKKAKPRAVKLMVLHAVFSTEPAPIQNYDVFELTDEKLDELKEKGYSIFNYKVTEKDIDDVLNYYSYVGSLEKVV
ncbi:MAG: hypothetical protein DRJ64_08450 [Thermoprotei archaeon]|nr:MAG: hypothetical protein DRJ64_08450 [Thermoprotei archaeon]